MLIGNDIVDLTTADRSHHPRFPRRIFSDRELDSYTKSGSQVRDLWLAWAAKEAAYKLEKQRDPTVYFSPREFVVDLKSGTVTWRGTIHRYQCEITPSYVHVWVAEAGTSIHTGVRSMTPRDGDRDQSAAVRRLAVELVAGALGIDSKLVCIQTDVQKIPYAVGAGNLIDDPSDDFSSRGGVRLPCALSMSHDGAWVAAAVAHDASVT